MNIIKEDKNEIEIEIENLTIAELLRVYLTKISSVDFVAWRRDHPTEKAHLLIKTKSDSVKKVLKEAISQIEKDLDEILKDFKKISK